MLMAIYRPRLDWLKVQLQSIAAQTYHEIELLIQDDCPDECIDSSFFREALADIPFEYERNDKNLGTAATFARLIERATGEYIAFCDQDDVWDQRKLAQLEADIQTKKAALVYCGLSVIDENGLPIARDVSKVRKRQIFLSGTELAPELIVKSSIYGCSMLMTTRLAKASLPFGDGFGHDHWLCLFASTRGLIYYEPSPLVYYRIHGNNQSSALSAVQTKDDYYEHRILNIQRRVVAAQARFPDVEELKIPLAQIRKWAQARDNWYHHKLCALPALLKYGGLANKTNCFELVLPLIPSWLFHRILNLIQTDKI